MGPKGDPGPAGSISGTLLADLEDLKQNAMRVDKPFAIKDGNNQWLSKSGGGGLGAWERLQFLKL
jgi:hypothetical protein